MINVLNFEASNLKLDKKNSLGLDIYFIGYVDKKTEWNDQRQISRWKRIVSRFKGISIKIIGDGKDSPKIRQILLYWGYELDDSLTRLFVKKRRHSDKNFT